MKRRGPTTAVAVLLVAAFLLVSCAQATPSPAPPPGAAPTQAGAAPAAAGARPVKVGLGLSVTGALATTTKPISYGVWDYLKYVNDTGGLKYTSPAGKQEVVTLDIKWEDMAYDPAKSVDTYRRLKDWGAQFMHLTAGSMVLSNLDAITRDHMPIVYYGPLESNSAAARPLYTVGEFPGYTDEQAVMMDWVLKNWKGSAPPKVGFLELETAMSRAELPGQVPDYAKKIGVDYVGHEWVPYAVTDTSVELKRLADKGADWVFLAHVPAADSVALKDAVRLGLKDKMKFVVVHWGFNELLPELAGGAADGVYGMVPAALPNEDLPAVKLARDTMNTYRPGDTFTSTYLQGFALGRFMEEVLKATLEKVGYEKLTKEAINDTMIGMKNVDVGGIVPNITINPDFAIMANAYRIGILQQGKFSIADPNWMPSHNLLKGWVPKK